MPKRQEDDAPVKKFLFDLNSFDEPEPVEPEDLPPTFSEDELAAARATSHEQGYTEGKAEGTRLAVQSREQLTANTLRSISESFAVLFAAEYEREAVYERESLRLALAALDKLFPLLNSRFGPEEVRTIILNVLQSRSRQSAVTIEVSAEDAPHVESLLAGHWSDPESAPRYRILAGKDLKPGQCRLAWEDGGAVRDAEALAAKIRAAFTDLLGPDDVPGVSAGQNNAINEGDADESAPDTTQTGENA